MPTQAGFWIRVQNGSVTDVWDYEPSAEKKAAEPGWREAVEVMPDLTANREVVTTYSFDIDVTPAQIIWAKRDLTVDERKESLEGEAKVEFRQTVHEETAKEMSDDPSSNYDGAVVSAAYTAYQNKLTAIAALTTHEDVDGYGS